MNIFTVDQNGKMSPYQEQNFSSNNREADLEVLLENNADQFFSNNKILIIGRQVATNLSTYIDLLGVDESGCVVVIELKRERTPRETIAQLLEYASYVNDLSYDDLNNIFKEYDGSGIGLTEYHKEYFASNNSAVSWNKNIKLLIIAQTITLEIQQVAIFLRKKGLNIACIEFRYFITKTGEKIISSDYTVGEDDIVKVKVESSSSPRIDKEQYIKELDDNGIRVFVLLDHFIEKNKMLIRWGSKGFSANYQNENSFVGMFFCYPKNSVFKQSIYTGFEEISKKVNESESVIAFYEKELAGIGIFQKTSTNYKCLINDKITNDKIEEFLGIVVKVMSMISEKGIKSGT